MADGASEHDRHVVVAGGGLDERRCAPATPHDRSTRPRCRQPGRTPVTDDLRGDVRVAETEGDAQVRMAERVGEHTVGARTGGEQVHTERPPLADGGRQDGLQASGNARGVLDDDHQAGRRWPGSPGDERTTPDQLRLERTGDVVRTGRGQRIDVGDEVRQLPTRLQRAVRRGDEHDRQAVRATRGGQAEHDRPQQFAPGRAVVADDDTGSDLAARQRDGHRPGVADTDDGARIARSALPGAGDGDGVVGRSGEAGRAHVGQRHGSWQRNGLAVTRAFTVCGSKAVGACAGAHDVEPARVDDDESRRLAGRPPGGPDRAHVHSSPGGRAPIDVAEPAVVEAHVDDDQLSARIDGDGGLRGRILAGRRAVADD
ncbi:MAG: hypothetical protein H0W46_07165, partial [Acidimicrobiia bacterium]|nr:hypothetical protein [Acidimicrobiia bacterium]